MRLQCVLRGCTSKKLISAHETWLKKIMMQLYRDRLCTLGLLLTFYLAGVFLIFSATIEPTRTTYPKVSMSSGLTRNFQVGPGIRVANRRNRLQWCRPLHFQKEPGPVVALASFPGSGNTWVRYLLQQATGIYTGSVYKDYGLLKNGFPAESVVNGSVSVVKTHEWGHDARQLFNKAVLLVREPGPAIQAEFNRQSGGHIGFASPDRYRRNKGKYWQHFVTEKLATWKNTNFDWLYNFTGPLHVVIYEHLLVDLKKQLEMLLDFLKMPVTEKAMTCALERHEGVYRRKRRSIHFDAFTHTMKQVIKKDRHVVYEAIRNVVEMGTTQ